MTALKPGPKDTKQYKSRAQHEANALHPESLPSPSRLFGAGGAQRGKNDIVNRTSDAKQRVASQPLDGVVAELVPIGAESVR
jgi:hypothetical protein